MKKIVDTYAYGVEAVPGGRCQKWWEHNQEKLNSKKNKKHRPADDPSLSIPMFLSEFSLKGVEFGNWLQQGERYDHLLAAGYGLLELSKLVGKNIGFDYNLGIAFGARGLRGAIAHFEPIEGMINITKEKSNGSLAHEYGHALDYFVGAYSDRNEHYAYLSGGSSVADVLKGNVNGDVRAMVNQIVDYVKTTDSYKILFSKTINKPYWHRRTEVFARFFEQYVAYKTQSKNLYLCKQWSHYISHIQYLKEDEFMQILPVAEKLIKRIKEVTLHDVLPKKTPYPEPIIYKPKGQAKEEPKTVDTKATKKEAVVLSKEEKDAIMRVLKYKIKLHNENTLHYLFTPSSNIIMPFERLLNRKKIVIKYQHMGSGTIEKEGVMVAKIIGNYASKKVNGFYKELNPTVKYL